MFTTKSNLAFHVYNNLYFDSLNHLFFVAYLLESDLDLAGWRKEVFLRPLVLFSVIFQAFLVLLRLLFKYVPDC